MNTTIQEKLRFTSSFAMGTDYANQAGEHAGCLSHMIPVMIEEADKEDAILVKLPPLYSMQDRADAIAYYDTAQKNVTGWCDIEKGEDLVLRVTRFKDGSAHHCRYIKNHISEGVIFEV